MVARRRLDAELVRRKIARSREQAVEMIRGKRVEVGGILAVKPATVVNPDVSIRVSEAEEDTYASRGAHKLVGALDAFGPEGLSLAGRRVLDAGASTGGFTDVCLRRGASEVAAVDVGYGQLIWRLQNDPRVTVLDRTNVRSLTPDLLGGRFDAMVGDLSFISLKLVLPAIRDCLVPGADLLPMVKPQFEVGKDRLGSGGVVRSPELRAEVTCDIARFAGNLGMRCRGVVASPLPGPSGNVEYFLWLVNGADTADGAQPLPGDEEIRVMVERAVEEGPR
ncbi:TlyA family RNA methyltransferase [Corynebacterium pygosceleis]|uniref:TlyA family RNA methyltransferase n=1 Tax=Corynebacterium pygosceleis TaxID=2800406 RepID=UPI00190428D3|nr:TlyA family RNA methyltransferase [Corynebacterium pygosceleis]MCK7674611.1 TlyA family RNA methyltransferase [Corynebacterium pygosceleis]MCL0120087.1 TlyA family RNA methyltransferase [Corynebacterium pygosceleis]